MNFPWLNDPKNGKPSVTVTFLVLACISSFVAGWLQIFKIVETTGIFLEMLWSFMALYLSRRLSFNGKLFSSQKAEEVEKKVSE